MSEQDTPKLDASAGAAGTAQLAGPGAILAQKRESEGLSVEQVARQLNLAARQIHALESNQFSALPGMASAKGFVRAYAKLLKINADPLIAMMATEAAPGPQSLELPPALTPEFTEPGISGAQRGKPSARTLLVFALVLVLIPGGYLAYDQGLLDDFVPTAAPGTSVTQPAAVPAPEKITESPAQAESNMAPSSALPASSVSIAAPPVGQLAPPGASSPVQAPPPQVTTTDNDGKNNLVLKLREDSWIQIRRKDNALLVSRVLKAGTTEAIEITQPVTIIVGNVSGVDVSLRGQPLDLQSKAKSNVARVDVK